MTGSEDDPRDGQTLTGWSLRQLGPVKSDSRPITLPASVVPLSWHGWRPQSWQGRWRYDYTGQVSAGADRTFLHVEAANTDITPVIIRDHDQPLSTAHSAHLPVSWEITDELADGPAQLALDVDGGWLRVPPTGGPGGPAGIDFLSPSGILGQVHLLHRPATFIADLRVQVHAPLQPASRRLECEIVLDTRTPAATATVGGDAAPAPVLPAGQVAVAVHGPGVDAAIVVPTSGAIVIPMPPTLGDEPSRGQQFVVRATVPVPDPVELWDLDHPVLYSVQATYTALTGDTRICDTSRTRIGFRDAEFTREGFFLNGVRRTLVGLNRQGLYPYFGLAAPDRAQRRDVQLIKRELNCDIVRTAHYPAAPAFLDACDELGLLVFEEIPGWHYCGTRLPDQQDESDPWAEPGPADRDPEYEALHLTQIDRMIRRDRNRPSIISWGVLINETRTFLPSVWSRAQQLARSLDDRPTSGAAGYRREGWFPTGGFDNATDADGRQVWPFDVFSYNDYSGGPDGMPTLVPPTPDHPYLVTEAVGQFPDCHHWYNRAMDHRRQQDQMLHHAAVHEAAAADPGHCGVIAWVAFDYCSALGTMWRDAGEPPAQEAPEVGSGEYAAVRGLLKSAGLGDVFRVFKPGAAWYRSRVDPSQRIVLEPAFYWDRQIWSEPDGVPDRLVFGSNCEQVSLSVDGGPPIWAHRDTERFGHIDAAPFVLELSGEHGLLADARRDTDIVLRGHIGGQVVIERHMSTDVALDTFTAAADDARLSPDAGDATRVTFAVTDRYGNIRPRSRGQVRITVEGPAHVLGEAFDGGGLGCVGAAWIVGHERRSAEPILVHVHGPIADPVRLEIA